MLNAMDIDSLANTPAAVLAALAVVIASAVPATPESRYDSE
jgi:hypothetical protein